MNGWLLVLPVGTFTELLPLLRRTVSTFTAPERRELGGRAVHGGGAAPGMVAVEAAIDPMRARHVLPILHTLLASRPAEDATHGAWRTPCRGGAALAPGAGPGRRSPGAAECRGRRHRRRTRCTVWDAARQSDRRPGNWYASWRPMRQAVSNSLNRAARILRPRHQKIDWLRTIRANLRHYQPEYRTVIPETRIGFGLRGRSLRNILLCVDQSGSMASSVVYAGVFATDLASIRAVSTSVVVFDTAVADLTPLLSDPVEVLFGTRLGGGTDINRALAYCQGWITRPRDSIFVLISDLYEDGNNAEMLERAAALAGSGVQVIALLALNDAGAPSCGHANAARLSAMGIPCLACTPDLFPDRMAAAILRHSLVQWTSHAGIVRA